jgi:hypothetical protein
VTNDLPRERRAPVVGLSLLSVTATATACILLWVSSDWRFRANTFYSDNANIQLTPAEYEVIDRLSWGSYQLSEVAVPLLIGAGAAVLALLTVLAWRWERKPGASDQATAAS